MRFTECAIIGCHVGSLKDRIERVRSNLGPPRFIRVTKNTQEEWSRLANQTFRSRQNICEKHFTSGRFGFDNFLSPFDILRNQVTENLSEVVSENISDDFEEFEDKVGEIADDNEDSSKDDCKDSIRVDSEEINDGIEYTNKKLSENDLNALITENISEQNYSLDDIQRYFSTTPLAENVSWCRNFKENEIVLIRTDCKGRVHCIFKIKNDMSVKVYTADNKVEINVNNVVINNDKLLKVLKMMLNKQWCEGSGNQNNSRSPKCTGFIYKSEMPKIKVQYSRCLSCKTLRHVEAKKEKRRMQRLIERNEIIDDASVNKQRKPNELKRHSGYPTLDHSYVKKTTVSQTNCETSSPET